MSLATFFDTFFKLGYHFILIYIIIGCIVYQVLTKLIKRSTDKLKTKRGATMQHMLAHILKYVIVFIVLLGILSVFGINVSSLVAGLGIIGIVIGFALQDVMKDYLVGLSIVFEEQFDVGDYVEINGHFGVVQQLNLKTTTIQTFENRFVTLSNRIITEVINYSKKDINIILTIPMPYDVETKKADKIVDNIVKKLSKEEDVIEEIKVWDFSSFEDSYIKYKICIPVINDAQFRMKRKANRIVKEEYDKNKISIPFNIVEVKNG